jgi:hypothetical protein
MLGFGMTDGCIGEEVGSFHLVALYEIAQVMSLITSSQKRNRPLGTNNLPPRTRLYILASLLVWGTRPEHVVVCLFPLFSGTAFRAQHKEDNGLPAL